MCCGLLLLQSMTETLTALDSRKDVFATLVQERKVCVCVCVVACV